MDLKSLVQKQATVHGACKAWDAANPKVTPIRNVKTQARPLAPITLKEKSSRGRRKLSEFPNPFSWLLLLVPSKMIPRCCTDNLLFPGVWPRQTDGMLATIILISNFNPIIP